MGLQKYNLYCNKQAFKSNKDLTLYLIDLTNFADLLRVFFQFNYIILTKFLIGRTIFQTRKNDFLSFSFRNL